MALAARRAPDDDPTRLPFRDRPAGTDCLPQIRHIVVLMMENHSFDNYPGVLGRGDGLPTDDRGAVSATNPTSAGGPVVRVPAVVVCPFARPDYVSHVERDHTSVLRLIERKWNLPPMTDRDAAADDLLDMVDFDADPAFAVPPVLVPPTAALGSGR